MQWVSIDQFSPVGVLSSRDSSPKGANARAPDFNFALHKHPSEVVIARANCSPTRIDNIWAQFPQNEHRTGQFNPTLGLINSIKFRQWWLAEKVRTLPTTIKALRAREIATHRRLSSARNPNFLGRFERTVDNITMLFSRPWNASTVVTSNWYCQSPGQTRSACCRMASTCWR